MSETTPGRTTDHATTYAREIATSFGVNGVPAITASAAGDFCWWIRYSLQERWDLAQLADRFVRYGREVKLRKVHPFYELHVLLSRADVETLLEWDVVEAIDAANMPRKG